MKINNRVTAIGPSQNVN